MRQDWLPFAKTNAPRYTSYPTALQFSENIAEQHAQTWSQQVNQDSPISVYVHVPFCEQLCWYCGCHTTIPNGYDRIASYLKTLDKEISLWQRALGTNGGTAHLHFGGGTPNALNSEDMLYLLERLHVAFGVLEDAEIAAELDPRTLDMDMVRALAAGGLTRASLGVQDFNETVQKAVNRVQPYSMVKTACERLRNWGIHGLNFDLLFGLPHQTTQTAEESARLAASLQPDRISAFGYAHVPWFAKHQRAIDESALPDTSARFDQFNVITETLAQEGYVSIGLDHFAREDDPLAIAKRNRKLNRNFQGYTDDYCDTLIALGPSGVSQFAEGYVQNAKNIRDWKDAIESNRLSCQKGVQTCDEDRLRRDVIHRLMCDLEVDFGEVCKQHHRSTDYLDEAINRIDELSRFELCTRQNRYVRIPETARMFTRIVAQSFDKLFTSTEKLNRHSKAV